MGHWPLGLFGNDHFTKSDRKLNLNFKLVLLSDGLAILIHLYKLNLILYILVCGFPFDPCRAGGTGVAI